MAAVTDDDGSAHVRLALLMFIWWGEELFNVYNDAYAPLLGRHPTALGQPAKRQLADTTINESAEEACAIAASVGTC